MQNVTVSVIIPVYNTKSYLQRCVDSVLMQKKIEPDIVLVDDGSTDGSGALCDMLAAQNKNITVYHNKNGGGAAARNFGLSVARGDYVLLLDSDDCYLSDMALDMLCETAQRENADVVCFHYTRVRENERQRPLSADGTSGSVMGEKAQSVPAMVERNLYTSSSCLKLMRRTLLSDNKISFNTALRCEDILFCLQVLVSAKRPVFLDVCLYGYTVREGSITRTCNAQTVQDTLSVLDTMQKSLNASDVLYEAYMGYVAFQYCTLLINAHLADPKTDPAVWRQIYAKKNLLQYRKNRIVRMVSCCSRCVGIAMTARLLTAYFKKNG
ncbi:MAG: glycosyltransferase family 2 protein [Ruthenibacterium sp.]